VQIVRFFSGLYRETLHHSSTIDVKLDNKNVCHAPPAAEAATHGAMTTACRTLSSCSTTKHPSAAVVQESGWNESSSALCHSPRPRPARRRRHSTSQNRGRRRSTAPWMSGHSWVFVLLFSILICCQQAEAGKLHGSRRFARKTNLVFDKRVAPEPRMRLNLRKEHHQAHDHFERKSGNDTALKTDPQASQLSLPHPFDTSLGNNFTAPSCPAFFNTFLNSDSFNNCLPFSLLLQVCVNARDP
jgi:hypothetical protein